MERYILDKKSERIFRQCFQMGGDMDGYIYTQEGEGIGSFFGNLFKKVIPLATKAIKGIASAAKPHLQNAAKDFVGQASKKLIEKIAPAEEEEDQPPRKRQKRKKRRRS